MVRGYSPYEIDDEMDGGALSAWDRYSWRCRFVFIPDKQVADCMSQETLRDGHEKFVNLLSSVVNEIKERVD